MLQIYREVRECRDKSCQARITPKLDFVDKRERFTIRAKQKAIASVTEDGVPLERVPQRMWRDFHVRVAKSTVHNWVHAEAEADLGETEYTQWVTARFSGMVGIDEVHLRDENGKKQYLAVVVDDHYMNITHIARGDDWIPSTPKRILIYQALDWEPPVYCHVPLVNGPDGKKLGKRHGATSITEFRKQGYLPEALFNFLALLGWSPGEGEEQEIFDREELIERFDLFRVNRASAAFSYKKLDWMNGVYIRNLPEEDLLERFLPFWQKAGMVSDPCPGEEREKLRPIVPLVQERLKRLSEIVEWTAFLFQEVETPPVEDLLGKKMTVQESLDALRRVHSLLAEVEPFEAEAMEQPMRALADESGLKAGQLFGIVRSAVTGQKVAPPLFGSLALVGREMVLARLDAAEAVLEAAL